MTGRRQTSASKGRDTNVILWVLLAVQAVCAAFFIWDLVATVFGLRSTPVSWQVHEMLEIAASIGLVLGAILGFRAVISARERVRRAEQALKSASGAFAEVVENQFYEWGLTNAERDVAWFAIKGFSATEIAGFRGTSEGTIKAQSNAIYRKAGVTGRSQLLSTFVEYLLDDDVGDGGISGVGLAVR